MPIYEYQCKKCGHHTEVLQKFSDPPLSKCEICDGDMKKLISHSAFHLKGTGWYVTDYASKSNSSRAEKRNAASNSSNGQPQTETKGTSETASKDAAAKAKTNE